MNHKIRAMGYGYLLRPVRLEDAQFIIDVRLEDQSRNQFIHKISPDIKQQEEWITKYLKREGDYYFVIENILTKKQEGLISIYNVSDGRAEWGRWVIQKGSMAAVESVNLIYKIAFEKLNLYELYSCTVEDNKAVVSFHKSIGQKLRAIHHNAVILENREYNVVEQFVDKDYYYTTVEELLSEKSEKIFLRNLRNQLGRLDFHHIGVATSDIKKEQHIFSMLGYKKESEYFEDPEQGIKGVFMIAKNQPRIELLENMENRNTLTYFVESGKKIYHFAYFVDNIDNAISILSNCRIRIVSPLKMSTYFKNRICFLVLPNKFLIELIER